jgi:uncharacterized membrane-anchored protein
VSFFFPTFFSKSRSSPCLSSTSFGSLWLVFLGAITFVLSQLSKMLFLATFLPDAAEGAGVLSMLIRVVVATADILAFVVAFRYARGDPRGRFELFLFVSFVFHWSFV